MNRTINPEILIKFPLQPCNPITEINIARRKKYIEYISVFLKIPNIKSHKREINKTRSYEEHIS